MLCIAQVLHCKSQCIVQHYTVHRYLTAKVGALHNTVHCMRTSFQKSEHCTVPCIAQVLHCKSWCIAQHRAAHKFFTAESLCIAHHRALHENFIAKVSASHNPLHCTSASLRPPVRRPPLCTAQALRCKKLRVAHPRRSPWPRPHAPPAPVHPPLPPSPPSPPIAPPGQGGEKGAASGRGHGAGGGVLGCVRGGRGGQICVSCTFSLEGLLKSSGSCTELSSGFLPQPSAAPLLP